MSGSARQGQVKAQRSGAGASPGKRFLCIFLTGVLLVWSMPLVRGAEAAEPSFYLIGPGDELQITVWREAELSTVTTVRPDGRISIPLIDDLLVAGKTPGEVDDAITEHLAEYLENPSVTVAVVSGLGDLRQQVRVVGRAAEPRAMAYRDGMTLLDAVIEAGGLSRQAAGNSAVIVRQEEETTREIPVRLADLVREGDVSANVPLQPGDIIVIPEGFLTGEWRVDYRLTASETVSDNIDQEDEGGREIGLVARAGPGISIAGSSARVVAGVNGDLIGVHQAGGDDEGFSLDPRIAGLSTTEVSDDLVFFDLSGSVSRQLLDARRSTSAAGASTRNRDLVAAFTASPYVVHRLGDFANVEWRYRFSPVVIDSDDNADAVAHEASLVLDSGEAFPFLGWTFANRVGEEVRSGESDISTASTDLGVIYPLWRSVALLGGIGYEYRDGDEDEEDNFDGITWRGGFQYAPHPDLRLQATYGRRQNDESLDAALDYQISPKTSLIARYAEALETGQQRALSNLGQLILDPETGELIDPDTGEPFTGDLGPFTFEDQTTRTRTLRVGATHRSGRDLFGLSALRGTSEGGSRGDEEFYGASVTWSRPLSSELSLGTRASYDHSDFEEDDRTDDTYRLNLSLGYRLSPDARGLLSYNFQARDSSQDGASFYENAVTIGITISF